MWFLGLSAVLFVVAAAWSSEFFASDARGGDALGARASLPPVDQAMVADLAVAAISARCPRSWSPLIRHWPRKRNRPALSAWRSL